MATSELGFDFWEQQIVVRPQFKGITETNKEYSRDIITSKGTLFDSYYIEV